MKKNKLFSLGMLAALLAFGLVLAGCDNPASDDPVSIPATGVTIDQGDYINLVVGHTLTLTATVTPADSTDQVVWSSGDTTRATVDASSGVVTGVGIKAVEIHARAGSVSARSLWDFAKDRLTAPCSGKILL